MQPHHEVTLSCLWHVVKKFLYFVECECKHSDDQRIVKDANTLLVGIDVLVDEHGDVHADDSK